MKSKERIGVLLLGYNNQELNNEMVLKGTPAQPGRLIRFADVILRHNTVIAVISGGMGVKDGIGEAEWARRMLYQAIPELKNFTSYHIFGELSPEQIKEVFDRVLVLEDKAKNTAENLLNTGAMFDKASIDELVVVTSLDHVSRGYKEAILHWEKAYPNLVLHLSVTNSFNYYSARPGDEAIAKIENVVIAEPPVMKIFNLARMFRILKNPEALAEIDAVLKKNGA